MSQHHCVNLHTVKVRTVTHCVASYRTVSHHVAHHKSGPSLPLQVPDEYTGLRLPTPITLKSMIELMEVCLMTPRRSVALPLQEGRAQSSGVPAYVPQCMLAILDLGLEPLRMPQVACHRLPHCFPCTQLPTFIHLALSALASPAGLQEGCRAACVLRYPGTVMHDECTRDECPTWTGSPRLPMRNSRPRSHDTGKIAC